MKPSCDEIFILMEKRLRSQALFCTPVISATQEAEAGGL
jgi:hypothetical protein